MTRPAVRPLKRILALAQHDWDHEQMRPAVREAFHKVLDCGTAALGAEVWTHPGKVEAPYTVCIASASNLTGLVKSRVECRRTGL